MPDDTIPTPTIEKSEGLIMSQPQQPEVLTVSAFLQRVQEARAKKNQELPICYEHLKIVNDKDSGSEQQLLVLKDLHLRYVDFSNLNVPKEFCAKAVAYRCNFRGSNWSNAQGELRIYGSDVSDANFADAEGFLFCNAYNLDFLPAKGLTAEQAKSIIPVSNETRRLLGTCNTEHFNHIIEEQKRISGLEATVAALAAQVEQLSQRQQ